MARGSLASAPDLAGILSGLKARHGRAARRGDRVFKAVAATAGSTIVVAIGLIAMFLLIRAVPSLRANHANFFTSAAFETTNTKHPASGLPHPSLLTPPSSPPPPPSP